MSLTDERLLQQRNGVPLYPGGRNLVGIIAPRLKVVDLGISMPTCPSGIVIGCTTIQSLTTDECSRSTEAGPTLWTRSSQTEAMSFPVSRCIYTSTTFCVLVTTPSPMSTERVLERPCSGIVLCRCQQGWQQWSRLACKGRVLLYLPLG